MIDAAEGRIVALHRYPVKSMGGESLQRVYLNPFGLENDRLYAFESAEAPPGMLRVSGAQRRELLRYRAWLDEEGSVLVTTPHGNTLSVDSPALLGPGFALTRAETPQTDVRPLSLISVQTIHELSRECGQELDPRRFRANLIVDLSAGAFSEDALAGRILRLGDDATILIRERDPRCRFITYDPAAPQATAPLFALMKVLDRSHQGRAGVYASVIKPGVLRVGDRVNAQS